MKIIVAYHKPAVLLQSELLLPLHVGREVAETSTKDGGFSEESFNWLYENMIGDNTGDNISSLNRHFCELTAIYWAWKNHKQIGSPEHIGFMHYRRHFSFERATSEQAKGRLLEFSKLDDAYIDNNGLSDTTIQSCANEYDIILPEAQNYPPYKHFSKHHDIEYYDQTLQILIDKFPEYEATANEYNFSEKSYFFNMFVMKKELFFEYCDWLFTILFELDKQTDYQNLTVNESRLMGFISERLLGIFVTHKKKTNSKLRIKELPVTYVKNTDLLEPIVPAFESNNIAVAFSTDANYANYLGVVLESLIEHSSINNNYDVIILDGGVGTDKQMLYRSLFEGKVNFSLRFVDINSYITGKNFYLNNHFTVATYYRFFISDICKDYDKVLYLDCDIIILKNVAELYNIDISDNYVAAVPDIEVIRWKKEDIQLYKDYYEKILNLTEESHYFNAGILLINIKKWLEDDVKSQLFKKLEEIGKPKYVDQCILNAVCDGRIKYLDSSWNVLWQVPIFTPNYIECMPAKDYEDYNRSRANPFIVHYASEKKPWNSPDLPMADYWWIYARKTEFYEQIIYKNAVYGMTYDTKSSKNGIQPHVGSRDTYYLSNLPIFSVHRSLNKLRVYVLGLRVFKKEANFNTIRYHLLALPLMKIKGDEKYTKYYILGIRLFKKKHF